MIHSSIVVVVSSSLAPIPHPLQVPHLAQVGWKVFILVHPQAQIGLEEHSINNNMIMIIIIIMIMIMMNIK
mgnify:CR=1 FL=1